MFCTSCGKQIANGAAFCPHCGKPVPQSGEYAGLVAAARAGDQDAIGALYEKTYSKVYYTVKSMIKDEDAVFDIVQDAYIKAFAHLDSFQGDAGFLPWVRQIAANTARDWLKKKRPMLFTEMGSGDAQDTPVEELLPDERGENLPDQIIDQQETQRLIREIVEELPEDQRAAIGMFYYEEMSVKEIAAAMGASESAVKSRLMYGRGKIEKKVRELEKRGTKLYSLSPIPFLLLLFRNQKLYAVKTPDARILQAILALRPMGAATAAGAAQGAGTAGAAAGAEATGTAGAGTAAVSSSLGALKIGLIALATVTTVGLGIFSATQLVSRLVEPGGTPSVEDVAEDGEESEESGPIDEALEQYRAVIAQADSYDFGTGSDSGTTGYLYALVQMRPGDPVPALLLEAETEQFISYIRVFQYDAGTKTMLQPAQTMTEGVAQVGGYRGGLTAAGDGAGIISTEWSSGTGETTITRITLDGEALNGETIWTGLFDDIPDSVSRTQIEWHEIADLSALESWAVSAPAGQTGSGALPADGERIVLTGTVGTFSYDEIVALQGQPDPNASDSALYSQNQIYRVIVLDSPQTLSLRTIGDGPDGRFSSREALMINISYTDGLEQYEGQHITFSIDPNDCLWPSSSDLPLGQPSATDIHVLD